jgi:hypothetical protein
MESFEAMVRFFYSYPVWARIAVIACLGGAALVITLSPRIIEAQVHKQSVKPVAKQVFLKILPIRLFPSQPAAEVQISAFVNDTEYRHPEVGGVEWMKTGASMSAKYIELPTAERYDVRFELRIRDGQTLAHQTQQSQSITPIRTLPFQEEYQLYPVKNKVRDAAVSAVIAYEVSER